MPTIIERIQAAWNGREPAGPPVSTDDYAVDLAFHVGTGHRGASTVEVPLDSSGAGKIKNWTENHSGDLAEFYNPVIMRLEAGGDALRAFGPDSSPVTNIGIQWVLDLLVWRASASSSGDEPPAGCPLCS